MATIRYKIMLILVLVVLIILPSSTTTSFHFSSSRVGGGTEITGNPTDLLRKFFIEYVHYMSGAAVKFSTVGGEFSHPRDKRALADCVELMELSIHAVRDTITALTSQSSKSRADAHTFLSAVLTNHITCMAGINSPGKPSISGVLDTLISRATTALAVFVKITGGSKNEAKEFETTTLIKGAAAFPPWVKSRDRKLLQSKGENIKADYVVSKDGRGDFSTLSAALEAVTEDSVSRVVIYVKKGIYNEYVDLSSSKRNIMIVGDGMTQTIFTGHHSHVDNYTTYSSCTIGSKGKRLILQDLCIRNTAGPDKHQAVALRVGGDCSIINRCLIDGYQDTLYAHSLRQFYRDCNISGTVDFLFGNAAAVFQRCNIIAKKPTAGQQNMVTAQSRTNPNQNTGFSLQFCNVIPSNDLRPVQSNFNTFLGRPWRNFSRTMVMESFIDRHISPAGWHEWSGGAFLDTCWFGEFRNKGPGSVVSGRVRWPCFHAVSDPLVALKFTVSRLLQAAGDRWVAASGVNCTEGLRLPLLQIN